MKKPEETQKTADHDKITIIKEFFASTHGKGGICVVRANCYDNRMSHFRELFESARKDFPSLAETDVRVEKFGGINYAGTFGIEFKINNKAPQNYKKIPNLELLR